METIHPTIIWRLNSWSTRDNNYLLVRKLAKYSQILSSKRDTAVKGKKNIRIPWNLGWTPRDYNSILQPSLSKCRIAQRSNFIALSKNTKANRTFDWVFILMNPNLKILLKIILNTIHAVCEQNITKEVFDCHNGLGRREPLLCERVLLKKSCEFRKRSLYALLTLRKRSIESNTQNSSYVWYRIT